MSRARWGVMKPIGPWPVNIKKWIATFLTAALYYIYTLNCRFNKGGGVCFYRQ